MFCANEVNGRQPNKPDTEEIKPSPAIAPAVSFVGGLTVETDLGKRRCVAQHLNRGNDIQQSEGDNRTRIKLKLERHEMRHRHDLQIGETGEIDLSHENRDHIAHDKAEQHGKLLGGAPHEQLERKASHQRNQAKRQILPAAEILRAGTAAEARGTDGQERKTNRGDDNRGNDRRNETTPILGRQTKHDLQQAAKHHGAGDCAITLMLRDRHGGRDVGEGNAGDHRQTGTNQPHTVQLQAGAETCDQQAGLNDGGGLRGIHLGGRGHREDRREIRHEHGHDVLQAERNALPERHRCVKTAQRLKRHAFLVSFAFVFFFGFLCVLLFAQLLHPLL